MSQINIDNLTFSYEGSFDNIFENVSFSVDSNWKLGFIGRNGKGKTTLLNLLLGKYEYSGKINSKICFEYFPFKIEEKWKELLTIDVIENIYPEYELWKICRELTILDVDTEVLYRVYDTLSYGEKTKVMLSILFTKENHFMLIDEPTNHLDMETRKNLAEYLNKKKGFLLVSHDRYFLDKCIDHVLVLNRKTISIESGNFSSWWENKEKRDAFELAENEKLKGEIKKLKESARRSALWADKVENRKIGFDPLKFTEHNIDTRAYLGEKSRRMQQRRKNLEHRQEKAIEQKEKLLKDIENIEELKIRQVKHHKDIYIRCKDFSGSYDDSSKSIISNLNFELKYGDRLALKGKNGCGKSTIIKCIINSSNAIALDYDKENINFTNNDGIIDIAKGLKISYINQDTSFLHGTLDEYILKIGVNNSLFKSVLRKLDFERVQFEKRIEEYSEGQKKKVLIAGSLLQESNLIVWDEPLNYVDIYSRMQIEKLLLEYAPTMILVEHDKDFISKIGTKFINL